MRSAWQIKNIIHTWFNVFIQCKTAVHTNIKLFSLFLHMPVLHTHFPPYSFPPPEKMSIYSVFPSEKLVLYCDFPPEKWVYTEYSPRKTKYVLTHTHFPHHASFPPSPILIGFFLCTLLCMYMVEDILVKCGRKRVSTMMIVITRASMNMEWERIRR